MKRSITAGKRGISRGRARWAGVLGAGAVSAAAGLCAPALGSDSAENAVLIINPASIDSMYIGNYYKAKRNIPDANVLYIDPNAANYTAFSGTNGQLDGFLGFLSNARIDDHADYVIVTPGNSFYVSAPGLITDGCSPVTRFAMGSVYTMAFLKADILGTPQKNSQYVNRYYSTSTTTVYGFDSNTSWQTGVPSTAAGARRYFIGGMLGYSGSYLGNSLSEMQAMIDRSVLVDGTRPAGTFYFMNNTGDAIRNVRNTQFSGAINAIVGAGGAAQQINGTLPLTKTDCLGILSGFASDNVDGGNFTILPGAFCDHLTSWAGMFDNGNQTKMSSWIRKGASGSMGEVEEPCNYTGKFPNAMVHYFYYSGMALGEAYFRSAQYVPFQGLLYGDPLTRPFAYIPSVNVTGIPGGGATGFVALTPSATTARPSTTIVSFDLLIDGVLRATTSPGGTLTLDTTLLDDGWHDLRVMAYDSTLLKTSGRFVGSITTANHARSVTVGASTSVGNLTRNYTFDVTASGGTPVESRILVNNRVVASAPGAGAAITSVRGMAFGPGDHQVQAEVIYSDGLRARSPRIPLTVVYGSDTLSGNAPIAFSYTKYIQKSGPAVVELPASFDNDPVGASYTVTGAPAHATISAGNGAFRVITPQNNPCGSDTITFTVATPSGTSNTGVITLVYQPIYKPCPGDYDNNGFVNGDDFDAYVIEFESGNAAADYDNNCFVNGDDFDAFSLRFELGC